MDEHSYIVPLAIVSPLLPSTLSYDARERVWTDVEEKSVIAFAELSKRINHWPWLGSRFEFRSKRCTRKGTFATWGWGMKEGVGNAGSFLLRSINSAVIRECINNFGIINSRIIPRERSCPATLPAALPRKQGFALCRVRFPHYKDATYRELRVSKLIVGRSNNFPSFVFFILPSSPFLWSKFPLDRSNCKVTIEGWISPFYTFCFLSAR